MYRVRNVTKAVVSIVRTRLFGNSTRIRTNDAAQSGRLLTAEDAAQVSGGSLPHIFVRK